MKYFQHNGTFVSFISCGGPDNTADYRLEKRGEESKRIKRLPNGEYTSTCLNHTQEDIAAVDAYLANEHAEYLVWLEAHPECKPYATV